MLRLVHSGWGDAWSMGDMGRRASGKQCQYIRMIVRGQELILFQIFAETPPFGPESDINLKDLHLPFVVPKIVCSFCKDTP